MNPYSIRKARYEELDTCAQLIREGFGTVAREFQSLDLGRAAIKILMK